ncbi:MAG: HPr family phosphocarrier protein [Anaerolineae bacterium]|jgi:phosphotransferase system HPr (HPr) family protein|nr:MAG: HPr family phosphocarrier protein [Anaerolineae bacterium]
MPEIKLLVRNKVGLHARPAALFVQMANNFKSNIEVIYGDTIANAKSILSVLTLGANQGATVTVRADGEDAEEALQSIADLFESNFNESE